METKVKKSILLKSGKSLQVGQRAIVNIQKNKPHVAEVYIGEEFEKFTFKSADLQYFLEGFQEIVVEAVAPMVFCSVVPSLIGNDVEPDGWDSEQMPSILLALKLI